MSEITQQIKTYCMRLISAQADSALAAAPDHLTNLADETKFPHDRTMYLDAMHELSFNRKAILQKFEEEMAHSFDSLTGDLVAPHEVRLGGVDTSHISGVSDLEEKLALETMSSKARTSTELPLHSVIRSINGMMGDDWVQHNDNPLDPENLIKAWITAIHVMQLQPKGNLALYGLFDAKVLSVLPRMYERVGSFLEKLPKKRQAAHKQLSESFDSDDDLAEINIADDFDDLDTAADIPDFSDIQTEPVDLNTQDYDGEPDPERRTEALVDLLDKLQRNRDLDAGQFYDSNNMLDLRLLLESVNAVPEGEINAWTIGHINNDVVDMTELLFSFIMEDIYLPEDIRCQIARLQIPYLKLGLQDKSIYVEKSHPARLLLNNLSQSISLWNQAYSGGIDMLLSEINTVVDKILNEYQTDPRIFSLIEEQFNQFLSGDSQVYVELAKQQQQRTKKTNKADNAKLYIESTLDKLCKNKRIPPVINQIIEEFWSKVLFLEYLKAGQDSDDFNSFIEIVKLLVDSVQPKNSELKRKEMAKLLPKLIKSLKVGFETISVASFETVEIFRELQECHMLVLKERPELEADDELEVSEEEYEEFKREQNVITEWNRSDLENALLEESIERSLARSDSDPHAFDDNRNIITSNNNDITIDASLAKANRERSAFDDDLQEARDAYEAALKDHNKKKGVVSEEDDFMAQFFQDPDFAENQYSTETEELSVEAVPIAPENDDLAIEEDIFQELDEDDAEDDVEEINFPPVLPRDDEDELEEDPTTQSRIHSNDDLDGRAHGALEDEFNELGDEQVNELIGRLKVGLWVDLFHADGDKVRAKIMAIVPTVGKYIFGNRRGQKIADYNKQSLADALRTGKVRVSEEDNAYDKTLESVIANLRVMKKAEDD